MAVIYDPFNPASQGPLFSQLDARTRAGLGLQNPQSIQGPGFDQIDARTRMNVNRATQPVFNPASVPAFARPMPTMEPSQGPNPQSLRLSQAFQPPVQPTFTDPQRSMAPPGVGDFRAPDGSQSPLLKPKGPINTPTPQGPIGEGGTQDAQSGSSVGNGPSGGPDTSNGNPWINPAQLAAMDGSGGKKPGEGLLSFMNSGAPTAFQNPQQGALPDGRTIDGAAELVDNPDPSKSLFGGGIGEKGSVASMLTGGSDMDPSSMLSGVMKLFGGFGGFGR